MTPAQQHCLRSQQHACTPRQELTGYVRHAGQEGSACLTGCPKELQSGA